MHVLSKLRLHLCRKHLWEENSGNELRERFGEEYKQAGDSDQWLKWGGREEEAEWRREKEVIKRNPKTKIWHPANDHSENRGETYANEISKREEEKKCRHKYHRWGFLTGIIPHFEKCHLWGASLWIILIEDIQLCGWVCSQTEGGVGIVCHQMNSWGETNEECREKEGGILIGPSLFCLCLLL